MNDISVLYLSRYTWLLLLAASTQVVLCSGCSVLTEFDRDKIERGDDTNAATGIGANSTTLSDSGRKETSTSVGDSGRSRSSVQVDDPLLHVKIRPTVRPSETRASRPFVSTDFAKRERR